MDESEYREIYHSVNNLRCCFEKAILTHRFSCKNLVKIMIADREGVGCSDQPAQEACHHLLDLIRKNATFVLKTSPSGGQLPHAKEIRVQCGGMIGIYHALKPDMEIPAGVEDIFGLIQEAGASYNGVDNLPYNDIIKTLSQFEGRKKRRRK
ncbi:MAG TPA: hypothetical protein ENI65_05435 [Gammaproteobacteria bacterium]|nr:hypothetical protein [Gammaproteobacteria bacterium]